MTETTVLLIHGFGGGPRDYGALKRYMKAHEHEVEFIEFFYNKKFGQVSLDALAQELAAYVRTTIGERKFFAIGFSQGGLIFRRFVFNNPEIKSQVRAAITVCTPHQGSVLARFGIGKGVADLRSGSALLSDLNAFDDGIAYYAVYNPFDPVVVPGTNARFARAVVNHKVIAPSHFLTFGHPHTLRFIEDVLFPPPAPVQ